MHCSPRELDYKQIKEQPHITFQLGGELWREYHNTYRETNSWRNVFGEGPSSRAEQLSMDEWGAALGEHSAHSEQGHAWWGGLNSQLYHRLTVLFHLLYHSLPTCKIGITVCLKRLNNFMYKNIFRILQGWGCALCGHYPNPLPTHAHVHDTHTLKVKFPLESELGREVEDEVVQVNRATSWHVLEIELSFSAKGVYWRASAKMMHDISYVLRKWRMGQERWQRWW